MDDIEDLGRDKYNLCSCSGCRDSCIGTPGFFDPAHLEGLLKENPNLMESLIEDYDMGNKDPDIKKTITMFLRPRTTNDPKWSSSSATLIKGTCVLLGKDGCTLTKDQRPICCLATYACRPLAPWMIDPDVGHKLWGNAQGRRVIARYEETCKTKDPKTDVGVNAVMAKIVVSFLMRFVSGK